MAKNTKTPVMILQELTVKKNYAPPAYEIIYSISGTHANRFDYRVTVDGVEAHGTGTSKQIGRHNAAHNALMKFKDLGIYDPAEDPTQDYQIPLQQNVPIYPNGCGIIKDVLPDISAQCTVKEDQPKISGVDNKALNAYNEFYAIIIPDKKFGSLVATTCEEFSEKTEEALTLLTSKLGLTYIFYEMQDKPIMVSLTLNTDTPFTTIGVSDTVEGAKTGALSSAFEIMELFMQL
ncbi:hypothetical protein NQ314_003007 [Rhamnusium bicolor]|uniref:DRBM domain-containing protein n=1 Tax=Rhamnusium bicolor TaxID=1586634 RepID=A0AAV8ZPF9_9CUCU|nr:hypothetical protein NQ314_003007 [Rhamnusium bicolor]